MQRVTYRMYRFPGRPHTERSSDRYVGFAYDYASAVMVATEPQGTYSEARAALGALCEARGLTLRWFDGQYQCLSDETILPDDQTAPSEAGGQ